LNILENYLFSKHDLNSILKNYNELNLIYLIPTFVKIVFLKINMNNGKIKLSFKIYIQKINVSSFVLNQQRNL